MGGQLGIAGFRMHALPLGNLAVETSFGISIRQSIFRLASTKIHCRPRLFIHQVKPDQELPFARRLAAGKDGRDMGIGVEGRAGLMGAGSLKRLRDHLPRHRALVAIDRHDRIADRIGDRVAELGLGQKFGMGIEYVRADSRADKAAERWRRAAP